MDHRCKLLLKNSNEKIYVILILASKTRKILKIEPRAVIYPRWNPNTEK